MKWISTKDEPFPKDGNDYFVIWKGVPGIAMYDDETEKVRLGILPYMYDSFLSLDEEAQLKIYYWMPIPELAE